MPKKIHLNPRLQSPTAHKQSRFIKPKTIYHPKLKLHPVPKTYLTSTKNAIPLIIPFIFILIPIILRYLNSNLQQLQCRVEFPPLITNKTKNKPVTGKIKI